MNTAIFANQLPIWEDCPFRNKIHLRYDIRAGEIAGVEQVLVWDPQNENYAIGPKRDWTGTELQTAMDNLAGATLVKLYGYDGYVATLQAKQIDPRLLSAETLHQLVQFNELYAWQANGNP